MKTSIYIEVESHSPKATPKKYGYVLEAAGKRVQTREGFGKITGTYHQATLAALIEALGRFKKGCEIEIHTENAFILNMLENNLPGWVGNGFKTTKGAAVANWEEWEQVWKLSKAHSITGKPGKHQYQLWLQEQMKE